VAGVRFETSGPAHVDVSGFHYRPHALALVVVGDDPWSLIRVRLAHGVDIPPSVLAPRGLDDIGVAVPFLAIGAEQFGPVVQ
jgi:hypothetical protein